MHSRPINAIRKDPLQPKQPTAPSAARHHGICSLPAENVVHITAYLDPLALCSLARVARRFHAHVADDHTWRVAFLWSLFGVPPHSDVRADQLVLLRRTAPTWKAEYIARFGLRRRWERSRTPTVVHSPVSSPVAAIHLLPNNALLSASLRFGIVARSLPLTGRILRGLLSPTPAGTGLFINNPNTQFSIDVSACHLTSDGGTAKMVWGFTTGRVAAMVVPKAIDVATKSSGKLVNCAAADQHFGSVCGLVWDDRANAIISASADGTVKLWDPKSLTCLATWADPDCNACVKLAAALPFGAYAVGTAKGDIVICMGIQRDEAGDLVSAGVQRTIPCPFEQPNDALTLFPVVSDIRLDMRDLTSPAALVTYENHPYFYRIDVSGTARQIVRFGDSSCGSITAMCPQFASKPEETSFILVGDALGWVSVYPWSTETAPPLKRFEAHADGFAVTALACTAATLVAGSHAGSVQVFDASTLRHIRTLSSLESRRQPTPVTDIILNSSNDVVFVSAGDHVMAWEASQVKWNARGGVRGRNTSGKKRAKTVTSSKGYGYTELKQSINESMSVLKHEQEHARRVNSRERKQQANLDQLGLSEAEAVEYLLMLSRDEAQTSARVPEEDIFDMDFDESRPSSSKRSSVTEDASTTEDEARTSASSRHSESDFPSIGASPPVSPSASVWSRSGGGSWGDRVNGSGSGSGSGSGISALSPRRSPPSVHQTVSQQEQDDLELAIQLSLQDS